MAESPSLKDQNTVIQVAGAEHRAEQLFAIYGEMHHRDSRVRALDADPRHAERPLPYEWNVSSESELDFDERVECVVRAVREEVEAQRAVHLIGFGLGAGVCVAAAARSNGTVSTLTLVAGWLRSDRLIQETISLGVELWDREPLLAQRYSSLLEHSPRYRRHLGISYDPTVAAVPQADERVLRRLNASYHLDVSKDAALVECPTLVVAPTHDLKVSPQHSYELYGAVKSASLLELDAGHGAFSERVSQIYNAQDRLIRRQISPNSRLVPVRA